jgi:hypothetical protein
MAKEDKVINIIKKRIQEAPDDAVLFNNSFPEFDDEYVGQILSSLSKQEVIHHLSRGVYVKAIETRFGLLYPSMEKIVEAIAKRDCAQVIPTGAAAQNYLGISTQVPMNYVFLTSGSTRKITIDGRTITFRHAALKNFAIKNRYTSLIVQVLKEYGEGKVPEELLKPIQVLILKHPEPDTIKEDLAAMPSWIRRIFIKTLKVSFMKKYNLLVNHD